MAGSLNRVQLIGNVGKDPDIKTFSNGNRVASFSIACSESWKDKQTGEKVEKTEWVNVSVFNDNIISVVERYVTKGSKLFVEGKFQTRKYEQNGQDRYATEVVIQTFGGQILLLGDAGGARAGGERQDGGRGGGGDSGGYGAASRGGSGGERTSSRPSFDADLDDEVPFATQASVW